MRDIEENKVGERRNITWNDTRGEDKLGTEWMFNLSKPTGATQA